VTNLCVLDFHGPEHTIRLLSVHPGVGVDDVLAASGCAVHVDGDVPETRTPSLEELVLIREVLDPRGLRSSEVPE
jgi:acyl CoA:acetate/3-ketoacid CoA transferase beta subunit